MPLDSRFQIARVLEEFLRLDSSFVPPAGFWNLLTLSPATRPHIYSQPSADRHELCERLRRWHPLANQACLLLLALANHCAASRYRRALLQATDAASE